MTREDLLQFGRDYAKFVVGGALTDDNCIPANDKGRRPDLPYITLKVSSYDNPHLIRDEVIETVDGGIPQERIRGDRRGVLTVAGFGEATEAWLQNMGLEIGLETTQVFLRGESVRVRILTETIDVSAMRDTEIEPQFSRDFTLTYMIETGDEPLVEFLEGEIAFEMEHREDDPDPLVTIIKTET